MPVSSSCPACGAPLDPATAQGAHVTCAFCHRVIVVPGTVAAGPSTSLVAAPTSALEAELRALLAREQKIEAIKRYRKEFGAPLLVAKNAIDALETGASLRRPEEVARHAPEGPGRALPGPGCVFALVLFVSAGVLGLWFAS